MTGITDTFPFLKGDGLVNCRATWLFGGSGYGKGGGDVKESC